MMLTRCPTCSTAFRVTPEQLRARSGKVRCGHCQNIFSALAFLEEERPNKGRANPALLDMPDLSEAGDLGGGSSRLVDQLSFEGVKRFPDYVVETGSWPKRLESPSVSQEVSDVVSAASRGAYPIRRSIPETYSAENVEVPWGETGEQPISPLHRSTAVFLALFLFGQIFYHYRTPWSVAMPSLGVIYQFLGIRVPLPRHAELITIETSDLQSDEARRRFVFSALLLNRAPFSQDWPALEMTLIDSQDRILSRRVLYLRDYLPVDVPTLLAPHGEQVIKLWISSEQLNATGYRLYVFYP